MSHKFTNMFLKNFYVQSFSEMLFKNVFVKTKMKSRWKSRGQSCRRFFWIMKLPSINWWTPFWKKKKKLFKQKELLGGALQNSCVTNLFKILDKYLWRSLLFDIIASSRSENLLKWISFTFAWHTTSILQGCTHPQSIIDIILLNSASSLSDSNSVYRKKLHEMKKILWLFNLVGV